MALEKREVVDRIITEGLITLIRTASAEEALAAAAALSEGGASLIEVTMTVPGAIEVVRELARRRSNSFIIGAGTVLDSETGRLALLAGAQFLVSPSLNFELIQLAHRYSVVVIPGALTPTEVLAAWNAGADFVKVFPVGQLGGPAYVRALKGPFPQILLLPSGGVNLNNVGEFIRAGATAVAVGSEIVDKAALREKNFQVIRDKTRAALRAIQEARPR
ncbi:MAG: bifunctional 4-hydroxy-2-oxoglutarate aldolase/2-dehydro-3-deoxy-phosphogluconate aldolase [Desulfarculus sp.]|jgi:2-dehydro-3-deoxyphosphogluconate aldolase/(4S)-4-hydroxy-2-oxoglutarate aldolase|nr:MAG: bifunctional 4-hydroxy-2-oxoglutarate aldolase/2-dehydro-3-deoxy-phosphogluconate aldolase [Desulfarculus sp.]